MATRDGDGWVHCRCGAKHWGLNGAAGILLIDTECDTALLQLRAEWTHGGQTWGIPGGARDSHETAVEAAIRELEEELAVANDVVEVVHDVLLTDHADWSYHTVIAIMSSVHELTPNEESVEARWVAIDEIHTMDLHPGLAEVWPELRIKVREVISAAR